MKRIHFPVWLLIGLSTLFFVQDVFSKKSAPPVAVSGGAGELTCAKSGCHTGSLNTGSGNVMISSDAPNDQYTPGNTYLITVTVNRSNYVRYGFEVLCGYSASNSMSNGTSALINTTETVLLTSGTRKYVGHKGSAGTTGSNSRVWTFNWTAPNPGVGDVTFYVDGNAANNDTRDTGDEIYTNSLTLTEIPTSVSALTGPGKKLMISAEGNVIADGFPTGTYALQLFDLGGKNISAQSVAVNGPEEHFYLDRSSLAPGIYFVRMVGERAAGSFKWVVF